MNKNTKRRLAQHRKDNAGNFSKPAHKPKSKPFPKVGDDMSMTHQREIWNKANGHA